MSFATQAARTIDLMRATPGWARLQALRPDCDDATLTAIVDEAARFSEAVLAPLNMRGDRQGCSLADGRVRVPDGFAEGFRSFAAHGWLSMDLAEHFGGQGLPLALHAACAPLFERGCVALMMAAGSTRAACHLLAEIAEDALNAEWLPRLAAGEWSATICMSEPDAGSDIGRLESRATFRDGQWRIRGRKVWISFGDHDMSDRIGHCLLARTGDEPGTRGISLFLVPDHIDGARNGITVERLEDKMGLHGSPTCALRFDEAVGMLLGEEGRGLPQLFAMISRMRLQTGCQGLGLASAAADIAEAYAEERRQGGDPARPAVAISRHPDIRRQLAEIRMQTETLRAAILELAVVMDLARLEPDAQDRAELQALSRWMLPLVKNFGADAGFTISNRAIQVLGGAGYTRDWPLEHYLRDARVMTIYEGTTGMQAIDLLTRRLWAEEGRGLTALLKRARRELGASVTTSAETAQAALGAFEAESGRMMALKADPETGLYQANAYFHAAWDAVAAWMAVRVEAAGKRHRLPEGAAA